jgi:hypothetical protein
MRRSNMLAASLVAFAAVVCSFTVFAGEKREVTNSPRAKALISESKVIPGDVPGHELIQVVRLDELQSSDPNIDGGLATVHVHIDITAGNGRYYGYAVTRTPSGDLVFDNFEGRIMTVTKAGVAETTFEGTNRLFGGTGKFANLKGTGKYQGKIGPDGKALPYQHHWTIEY